MKTINLFGSPGSGKSTGASFIFSKLKMMGISCELVNEFAKDLFYDKSIDALDDQIFVFGEQNHRLTKLVNKVDYAIIDSPILLSEIYGKHHNKEYPDEFYIFVRKIFNSYDNINFFINRVKPYDNKGRFQNENESKKISDEIKKLLQDNHILYKEVDGDENGYTYIVNEIIKNKATCG